MKKTLYSVYISLQRKILRFSSQSSRSTVISYYLNYSYTCGDTSFTRKILEVPSVMKKNCQGWSRAIAIYLLRPPIPIFVIHLYCDSPHHYQGRTVICGHGTVQQWIKPNCLFEWPRKQNRPGTQDPIATQFEVNMSKDHHGIILEFMLPLIVCLAESLFQKVTILDFCACSNERSLCTTECTRIHRQRSSTFR